MPPFYPKIPNVLPLLLLLFPQRRMDQTDWMTTLWGCTYLQSLRNPKAGLVPMAGSAVDPLECMDGGVPGNQTKQMWHSATQWSCSLKGSGIRALLHQKGATIRPSPANLTSTVWLLRGAPPHLQAVSFRLCFGSHTSALLGEAGTVCCAGSAPCFFMAVLSLSCPLGLKEPRKDGEGGPG